MFLSRLRIKDFALVSRLDVEFPKGIIALTGETGAGKSTILGSIQLLLGERADTSFVRSGAQKAVIEGAFEFEKGRDEERLARLKAEGFELDMTEPLIVRREIGLNGRAAAFFGDQMVTVKRLAELMADTVDIHSQHAQQSLTRKDWQRTSFDHFAGTEDLALQVSSLYRDYVSARAELEECLSEEMEARRREDLWRFQIKEVREANIKPGEEETLSEMEKSLSHAEEISNLISSLEEGLTGEEGSVLQNLRQLNRSLKQLSALYGPARAWESEMTDTIASLDDLADELGRARDRAVVDPAELARVQERIALLEKLKKKYACELPDLLEETAELEKRMEDMGSFEERRTALEKKRDETLAELKKAAVELTRGRKRATKTFSEAVEKEIAPLGMGGMRFAVEMTEQDEISAHGAEDLVFMIANAGQPLMPLNKIASGGELSRLTLALKCLSLGGNAVQILFFDEIDAGISATVAGAIAKRLFLLGGDHQVFVITHMPVIAAGGNTHYLVEKRVERKETFVTIKQLDNEERKAELARMLGGKAEEAVSYAGKLLKSKGFLKN